MAFEIASDEFIEKAPELHHYTTIDGLEKILATRSLWATHFEDLNDASEVTHVRAPLEHALEMRCRSTLIEWKKGRLTRQRAIDRQGGILPTARGLALDLIDALYKTSFKNDEGTAMAVPYIVSFCNHAGEEYESENGLLSQWRGYGQGGGVCLVFDTAGLVSHFEREYESAFWVFMTLGSANYNKGDQAVEALFPELLENCERIVRATLDDEPKESFPSETFMNLVAGATRFKHRGFSEEREVRLTAIPGLPATLELAKRERPDVDLGRLVDSRMLAGRRRIVLFEELNEPLPINRVIVGPARNQGELLERVRKSALPKGTPIAASQTPFV